MIGLAAALAITASGMSAQASEPVPPSAANCSASGEQGAGVLHRRWILVGWERAG